MIFNYKVPSELNSVDLVGKPIVHVSAMKQAAGEAVYLDDMPKIVGELYLAFVLSTKAYAKILKIDPSQALSVKGVVAYYDANDIPDHNRYVGPVLHDEEVFVSNEVNSRASQPVCGYSLVLTLQKYEFFFCVR